VHQHITSTAVPLNAGSLKLGVKLDAPVGGRRLTGMVCQLIHHHGFTICACMREGGRGFT
jgi:hypothetical protein